MSVAVVEVDIEPETSLKCKNELGEYASRLANQEAQPMAGSVPQTV